MKRILLLSFAVLICFPFSNAQEKDAPTKSASHVAPQDQKFVDMENTLWDAWKNKDRKPYDDLLSDKFVEVDVTGTYDKVTEISEMDKCDLKDYAILDPKVRHLNDEAVLLTYKATIHDICEGQPVPEHQIITILFVREKGKWKKVLDSEVPQPAQQVGSTQSAAENADGIRGAQDALIAAYIHRDTAALDRILADEYTFINDDAGGVANKKQILDGFKAGGDREITSYARRDDQVRMYGDVAVLTYRYQSTETYKGRENGGDFRVTRILVKRDGRWQAVGGQETRVSGSEPSASLPSTKTTETGFSSDQTRKTSDIPPRLIGSWRQVSDEEMLPDGSVVQLDEIGLLTYDTSGHMSGQTMRRSEPTQKIPSDSTYLSNGYDAYFGTFTVDEEEHTITHHVEGGVARPLVGKDLVRSYSFDGDRLIMKPANSDEHWKVVFEKNRAH